MGSGVVGAIVSGVGRQVGEVDAGRELNFVM